MNRRNFIRQGCVACLSMATIPVALGSCASMRNTTGKLVKDGLIVSPDDFRLKDGSNAYRSFIIIRNEKLKYPVCIYRFNETEYSALWMQCSHQGAELSASGDHLQCPAHGSEFNNKGHVINGPAATDLRSFPVTVNNNEIFIDLRKRS